MKELVQDHSAGEVRAQVQIQVLKMSLLQSPLPWANAFLASPSVGLPKEGIITFVVLQLRFSLA